MSNHLHLVASANNEDLSDLLRDFKKITSKQLIGTIINNKRDGRRNWMIKIFQEEESENSRNKTYQFWRQDNHPEELYTPKFVFQKINYIHNNPVVCGLVDKPEHYLYTVHEITMQQRNVDFLTWNYYNFLEDVVAN